MQKVLAAAAMVAVAGCDGGHPGATPQSTPKSTGSSVSAFPARRAGLWTQTVVRDGKPLGPVGKMRVCLGAATDARLGIFGHETGESCHSTSLTRDGGVLRFASSCNLGKAGVVNNQGTVSGDLASDYTVHSQTEVTGALLPTMNGRHVFDMTARYLGPCPGGMAPGDAVLNGGVKVNINRLGGALR